MTKRDANWHHRVTPSLVFSDQLAINHRQHTNYTPWVSLLLACSEFLSCHAGASDGSLEAHVWRLCEEKVSVGKNDIWGTANDASRRQKARRAEQWGRQHGGADKRWLSFRQSATSPTFAPKIDLNTEVGKRRLLQHSLNHAATRFSSKMSDCFQTGAKL